MTEDTLQVNSPNAHGTTPFAKTPQTVYHRHAYVSFVGWQVCASQKIP
jgi:hypothetical protein